MTYNKDDEHNWSSWPYQADEERIDIIGANGNEGSHYEDTPVSEELKRMRDNPPKRPSYYGKNDPYQFAMDNKLSAYEFNIIKYVTRRKGDQRLRDLECARNTLDRLIEYEEGKADKT